MKFKEMNKKCIYSIITCLAVLLACAGALAYKNNKNYNKLADNVYNMSFYGLVDYMDDVEDYLVKSMVTTDANHSAETLNYIWREANLAQICLSQIPISNEGLSNTQKFLNQVSEYSYTLARKCVEGKNLTEDEIRKLKELYNYNKEVNTTLMQLSSEIEDGTLNWKELAASGSIMFSKQNDSLSKSSFDKIEEGFKEYDGLIYDGAYSEHMTNESKKGITGDDIDEEKAKDIVNDYIKNKKVKKVSSNGLSENGNIETYTFTIELEDNNDSNMSIGITKKGGHIIFMNYDRNVEEERINEDDADKIAQDFLNSKGFKSLEKTYFIKRAGIMTINYAYEQDGVIIYPDLIKVKIALDNGEVLGLETTGYLNNHEKRSINKSNIISEKEAAKAVSSNLNIESSRLAIIPTEFRTEIFCWELKGKIEEREFLLYVNAKTGRVEDILIVVQNENGILTK